MKAGRMDRKARKWKGKHWSETVKPLRKWHVKEKNLEEARKTDNRESAKKIEGLEKALEREKRKIEDLVKEKQEVKVEAEKNKSELEDSLEAARESIRVLQAEKEAREQAVETMKPVWEKYKDRHQKLMVLSGAVEALSAYHEAAIQKRWGGILQEKARLDEKDIILWAKLLEAKAQLAGKEDLSNMVKDTWSERLD